MINLLLPYSIMEQMKIDGEYMEQEHICLPEMK